MTSVAALSDREAAELGPLLRAASAVAAQVVDSDQVYNCLWSHAGGRPVHLHYVVQPVARHQMHAFDAYGPQLQVAMFEHAMTPDVAEVERVSELARAAFEQLRI